jgi:hypothetical protein
MVAALTGGLAFAMWVWHEYWPATMPLPRPSGRPEAFLEGGKIVLRVRGAKLVGGLAQYDDDFFAYLMFDYLRTRMPFRDEEMLLTPTVQEGTITYQLKVVLPNDIITGVPRLYELASQFPFLTPDSYALDGRVLREQRSHTQAFVSAYNYPVYRKLEQLSGKEVADYARRFIRFKSFTDPRIRRQIEPVPHALDGDEAKRLAQEIVSVAEFYRLPLDFFLGIGAMENNYMNVKGDIGHRIWKRHASPGDVVLRRKAARVLVLDEASGVWQITREALRYAHSLYLQDKRDYSQLPEHLRPHKELDLRNLDEGILTTYAGILFRDLLNRFDGDVRQAVGAYNGGPGDPNPRYEAGVRTVADYARRMLEQASALGDRGPRIGRSSVALVTGHGGQNAKRGKDSIAAALK